MSRVLPILFNGDMVQAILDDRKTVTRRSIKYSHHDVYGYACLHGMWYEGASITSEMTEKYVRTKKMPCQPGDILYVRETWNYMYDLDGNDQIIEETGRYVYYADNPNPCSYWVDPDTGIHRDAMPWRPSIHMPKAAARIWLRITDVRPQRLQNMTLDDFLKEGIILRPEAFNDPENAYMQAKKEFIQLWDSTIPRRQQDIYGWNANPWVGTIEFERCEKPETCILKGVEPASDKRPCIGYQKSPTDDEPCEMCKGCSKYDGDKQ